MKLTKNTKNIYEYIEDEVKGQLVFDIGAANGTVTKIMTDFGADVVSVEPQKYRTEHSNFDKAKIILNKCISDENGEIEFFTCKNMPNISTCFKKWKDGYFKKSSKWKDAKKIECITIDSLIEEYGIPVYIKIDVEGYEDAVFRGMSTPPKMVSFEYTGGYSENFEQCMSKVKDLGFSKILAFEKIKFKKPKRKIINMYEFDNYDECMSHYKSLKQYQQGDILAIL